MQIFQDLGTEVLSAVFGGYNVCVFAYGQTSAGKSYTMMGDLDESARVGLIPRVCEQLFDRMLDDSNMTYTIEVSYLEIYNERVRDLLRDNSSSNTNAASASASASSNNQTPQQFTLKVREDAKTGTTFVQGLSTHRCSKYEQLLELIQRGNATRTIATTRMNDFSSRSHAIFTITFSQVSASITFNSIVFYYKSNLRMLLYLLPRSFFS